MLLGIWKNIEDLEDSINLPELHAILNASREREYRQNKFMAALKGIDLDDKDKVDAKERFEEVQRRVQAKLSGKTEQQLEMDELDLDFEVEVE